jgi:hypothetical protein
MFPADAEHVALSDRRLVENSRCCVLDLSAKAQELCVPLGSKHALISAMSSIAALLI